MESHNHEDGDGEFVNDNGELMSPHTSRDHSEAKDMVHDLDHIHNVETGHHQINHTGNMHIHEIEPADNEFSPKMGKAKSKDDDELRRLFDGGDLPENPDIFKLLNGNNVVKPD